MTEEMSVSPTSRGWKVTLAVEGNEVSGLSIVDQKVRVGKSGLKMAGIAGVWTADAHRKKGYASKVMWAAIDEMVRRRYDISILFGIADFYHRYGYAVCFANSICQIETDMLPATHGKSYRVRAAKGKDLPRIIQLYRNSNVDRSATTIRPKSWFPVHGQWGKGWRMPRMAKDVERRPGRAIVAEDVRGRILAYAAYDAQSGHCMVTEVGGTQRAAFPALAARVRKLAAAAGADRVRFCLPLGDPFGEYLGRFGVVWSVNYPENSGSMGRIVNLSSTMRKLQSTMEVRIKSAGLVLPAQGISFKTDVGDLTVRMDSQEVTTVDEIRSACIQVSQFHLTQLMFGYRSVEDLQIDGEIRIPPRLVPTLSTLFPKSNPYMWWGDRF